MKTGDVVKLDGGPWDGVRHTVTDRDRERGWLAVPVVGQPEPEAKTPNFDRAFGLPTPEPCKGYYRARRPGDPVWIWHPSPITRPSVGSLPYVGYFG